jgi:ABC-type glutathione transport system ATPase component
MDLGYRERTVLNASPPLVATTALVAGYAAPVVGPVSLSVGVLSIQRQRPVQLPEMPLLGRELLALTGALHRPVPPSLAPLMAMRVDRLSGGQFQLLQVWACLGSAAELVLLDEPTNNMDPEAIETLIGLFRGALDGRGVLVVSHEHDLLRRVCTRIVSVAA